MDWKDSRYLLAGSPRQQRAYTVLQELRIWSTLREFDPVLAGTVPLGIDTSASDLDIICEVPSYARGSFSLLLGEQYGHLPEFRQVQKVVEGVYSTVCRFRFRGEAIEVFGQAMPTTQQRAFRHMVVEHAVLQIGGDTWRTAVHALKRKGVKTEPAFAALLRLPGNPYEALLTLEGMTQLQLSAFMASTPLQLR